MNCLEKIVLASGNSPNTRYSTFMGKDEEEKIPLPEYTRPDVLEPEVTHIPASPLPEETPMNPIPSPSPSPKNKSEPKPTKAQPNSPRAPFTKSMNNIQELIKKSNESFSKKAANAWKNHVLQSLSRLEDKGKRLKSDAHPKTNRVPNLTPQI